MSAESNQSVPLNHPLHTITPFGKRAFDIIAASLLLVVLAPVFLAIAIIILLADGEPVFYCQERLGIHGKNFVMYKFRTMQPYAERDIGPTWASINDERITKVGTYLRRTHLDELPQLLNVLRGDMSLVGPRPERRIFAEAFSREIPAFPLRLNVKPGITGLAQVSGGNDLSPLDKLQYDLIYIRNMSWKVDLMIIAATIRVMLSGRGAR